MTTKLQEMALMDARVKEVIPALFLAILVVMAWIFVLVAGYQMAIKIVDTVE